MDQLTKITGSPDQSLDEEPIVVEKGVVEEEQAIEAAAGPSGWGAFFLQMAQVSFRGVVGGEAPQQVALRSLEKTAEFMVGAVCEQLLKIEDIYPSLRGLEKAQLKKLLVVELSRTQWVDDCRFFAYISDSWQRFPSREDAKDAIVAITMSEMASCPAFTRFDLLTLKVEKNLRTRVEEMERFTVINRESLLEDL